MVDLAILGQDPRFGGGARAQMERFAEGAEALGRRPEFFYLAHPVLRAVSLDGSPLDQPGLDPRFGRIDALNHVAAAFALGHALRQARSLWVVATTASYGYGAVRSGRPFGCWIGSGLAAESNARSQGLTFARRAVTRLNSPVLLRLEREVLRRASVVCATSAASRKELADAAGIPAERIRHLPIPVDVELFRPEPDDRWLARLDAPTIVFVGRASDPRKNVKLLTDAFPLIRRKVPTARLRLVGAPPDWPLPPGVEIAGEVAMLDDELRSASLFVLPSRQEGFGIVVAEALASGVPVISTPSGGPVELLSQSGGGSVLAGFSVEELAESVVELLQDEAHLLALRRAGRAFVADAHSPARFRERLADVFEELDRVA